MSDEIAEAWKRYEDFSRQADDLEAADDLDAAFEMSQKACNELFRIMILKDRLGIPNGEDNGSTNP